MREIHKLKDKVELSLDHRQVFFLFFGVSVVGCLVFAGGVMTGRRLSGDAPSLASRQAHAPSPLEAAVEPETFAFLEAKGHSDLELVPPTRDPDEPPRTRAEIEADRSATLASGAGPKAAATPGPIREPASLEAGEPADPIDEPAPSKPAKPSEPAKPAASKPAADKPKASSGAGEPAKPAVADSPKPGAKFTLQLKAFANADEADKLAAKLRSNGHAVRVDVQTANDRTWHRVRIGAFATWDEALEAKERFEKAEHVIAYVMRI